VEHLTRQDYRRSEKKLTSQISKGTTSPPRKITRYLVESDKTGKIAHKPDALQRLRSNA